MTTNHVPDPTTARMPVVETATQTLPSVPRPRGLLADGTVRTTGWIVIGGRVVSSAALAGVAAWLLLITALPTGTVSLLSIPGGVAVYGLWKLVTARLRPASHVRPLGRVDPLDLRPGQWVRLFGPIGPVGEVVAVDGAPGGPVHVRTGGGVFQWAPGERAYLVQPRN
ncbi:hypothetical protein LX15_005783 [Streptoalloteichus tenebrarius]|uniref:Integral membrane protein n=1 Tax=Streptoalloteichus tenebrarius (strain ATCC 17920 / DSM 40477 / JCM 4838 / CBS 697.72 / NBRC 16177 / NCIMB 11028 / NRRL B-12390 / A12253. 1 / ISP 5477) TaxID=1933 RepID=A0ABT1I2P1_STRSD|nr:hypothetical protein [Streptoalloteichus tenebrarius]MCP2262051.1 hypothetical protein [Streptoalloteichus tenebrarius]BFF01309.1 hypothetical protein GCM10020241_29840 [Streptoalloteichus tenebrarius]